MEKINIAELLKDCPKGMELDCYLFNGLEFDHIDTDNEIYPIVCRAKTLNGKYNIHTFNKYGWYSDFFDYSKCVIFPKGKTTWEGFHRPFKDGDILAYNSTVGTTIFIHRNKNGEHTYKTSFYVGLNGRDKLLVYDKYSLIALNGDCDTRLATEEEKAKLFQAIKDNGYKWDEETKTLEKLIEPKFKVGDKVKDKNNFTYTVLSIKRWGYILNDIYRTCVTFGDQDKYELVTNKFDLNTLVPFESKALVRNDESQCWVPAFWGCKRTDGYTTTFGWCKYCIPFGGNEHLLGKKDDCDEYFKTWK